MSQLTPCPECQRHVRKSETRCPFCGEAVSLADVPAPALPRKRLGRAATFAFGASVVGATALVACGDDDPGAPVPVYGAPSAGSSFAGSDSSNGGSANGGTDNYFGGATAVYGAPAAGSGSDEPGGDGGNGGASGNGGAAGEGGVTTNGGFGGGVIYGAPPSGSAGI